MKGNHVTPYPNITRPLQIRGKLLQSRFIYPYAQPHFLQGPESYPAEPTFAFYEDLAKNGAGIILYHDLTNPKQRDFSSGDTPHFSMYDLYNCGTQNYLSLLASVVHYHGALIGTDICADRTVPYCCNPPGVRGAMHAPLVPGLEGVDSRAIFEDAGQERRGPPPMGMGEQKMLTPELMEDYIKHTIDRTKLYKSLGFDCGVFDIDQGLIGDFIMPDHNLRTDEYGGAYENRARFPIYMIRRVREALGEDFILIMNVSSFGEGASLSSEDALRFLGDIEPYIDLVHMRTHVSHVGYNVTEADLQKPKGAELSRLLKDGGIKTPITTNTDFMDLEQIDELLATGDVDMISAARLFLCNQNLGELIRTGNNEDVTPCVKCNRCHGMSSDSNWLSVCTVNPVIGISHRIDKMTKPPGPSKRIAVVGGGPAGMKAAGMLAERGHKVTLYEKGSRLGGQLSHCWDVSFKWSIARYLDFLIKQMNKHGVNAVMETEATPELIRSEGFDIVIAATGAAPVKPNIPGAENTKWNPANVYGHEAQLGKRVVCIGGSSGSVEAAAYLAMAGHEVTVLTRQGQIGLDINGTHARMYLQGLAAKSGVKKVMLHAETLIIEPGKVTFRHGSQEKVIECDDVVAAGGITPLYEESAVFHDSAPEFYCIGDSRVAGDLRSSIFYAFAVASNI